MTKGTTRTSFKALVLEQEDGATRSGFQDLSTDALPDGDVLVEVAYTTLNYKDGLAITGKGRIVRDFPFVPGIDFAGTVAVSQHPDFAPGDPVVLTGWGVGERHWGGMAQMARVKGDWLVPLPEGLDAKRAMAIGTAGFTAMLSVLALEEAGVRPGGGEAVVTGASGGVGGVAVALLAKLGHEVTAVSGRKGEQEGFLKGLGAASVMERAELAEPTKPPLLSARFVGGVDAVGGVTLANVLKQVRDEGAVAACGLAGGTDLPTSVMPFILRGVKLLGINSVSVPKARRVEAWRRLVADLPADLLDGLTEVRPLTEAPALAEAILKGAVRGRVVLDVSR